MKMTINEILETFREFVTDQDYKNTPILSAYVNIDPTNPANNKAEPAWQIELKDQEKKIAEILDPSELKRRASLKKWNNVGEMAASYLTGRKITGRSVVLFSDLSEMIAIDMPIPCETRLYYGFPQIKQLLFAIDQYKKYLVVLPSGYDVRFLEVFLTKTTKDITMETDIGHFHHFGRRADTAAKERRDAEYERRFAHEVADSINDYFMKNQDIDRIIFGGNQKEAHAIKKALHPKVQELIVAMVPMDFKLSDNEVANLVQPIAINYEEQYDLSVVENLESSYHTGVKGQKAVEDALKLGDVKQIILPYPIDSDIFDELIVEATMNGSKIEFVYGEAADRLNELGGIGAILYYSLK